MEISMHASTHRLTHTHTSSGTCVHTLCTAGLQAQRVPQPGAPSHALGDGPTWRLMLEASQWYRNPPVLCSQPQKPRSRASNENKPSSHLPGEVLKGRSAQKASFLPMQLQPQPGPVLVFYQQMSIHLSQAALQFISIYCLPFSSWDLVLADLYGVGT